MVSIVKIDTSQINPARTLSRSFGKRLQMMAIKRKRMSPLEAAVSTAKESVTTEEKANGKFRKTSAYENGRRTKEILVRAGAIVTDTSGKTATYVANETINNQEELEGQRELKRKEEEEKFGGPPSLIQIVLEGLGKLDDPKEVPPITRRFVLFGGPKRLVKEAVREAGPLLLPWPFNRIAALFNFLKPS